MKTTHRILVVALALGLAGSASAASKTTLTTGNNTIAGPGAISIAAGGSERIYTHPNNTSDACVTVVNTGRVPVGVAVSGGGSPTGEVPVNGTEAVCADDVTQIDLACTAGGAECTAQWRVDSD
jgi:hypothetical protein